MVSPFWLTVYKILTDDVIDNSFTDLYRQVEIGAERACEVCDILTELRAQADIDYTHGTATDCFNFYVSTKTRLKIQWHNVVVRAPS